MCAALVEPLAIALILVVDRTKWSFPVYLLVALWTAALLRLLWIWIEAMLHRSGFKGIRTFL
jgi:hypothetical protein